MAGPATRWLVALTPPWLSVGYGTKWTDAIGGYWDSLGLWMANAIKQRMPYLCASDALPVIGQERGLPIVEDETTDAYRERLVDAWNAYAWAGSNYGIDRALACLGWSPVDLTADGALPPGGYSTWGWVSVATFNYQFDSAGLGVQSQFWTIVDHWMHPSIRPRMVCVGTGTSFEVLVSSMGMSVTKDDIRSTVYRSQSTPFRESFGQRPPTMCQYGYGVLLVGGVSSSTPTSEFFEYRNNAWEYIGNTFAGVWGGAMAPEPTATNVVHFGGVVTLAGAPVASTARYNGTSWTTIYPATTPTARCEHCMCRETSGNSIFHGGWNNSNTDYDETWRWNGTDWTNLAKTCGKALHGHRMAYCAWSDKIIMFGGVNAAGTYNDRTYQWDGANWTDVSPVTSPSGRKWFAMAAVGPFVYLFGGQNGSGNLKDTWVWTGSAWNQLGDGDNTHGCLAGAAYDVELVPLVGFSTPFPHPVGTMLPQWHIDAAKMLIRKFKMTGSTCVELLVSNDGRHWSSAATTLIPVGEL